MHNKLYKQIIYLITHPKRNKNKFLYFFVSIVVLLLFIPFLEGEKYTSALLHLLTTIILLTGIYAVSHTRKQIVIASVLGLPWLIANWVSLFVAMKTLGPGAISWGALFFIYTTTIMFSHVIKGSKVTIETLF